MKSVKAVVARIVSGDETIGHIRDTVAGVVRGGASVHRVVRSQDKTAAGRGRVGRVRRGIIAGATVVERAVVSHVDAGGNGSGAVVAAAGAVDQSASISHGDAKGRSIRRAAIHEGALAAGSYASAGAVVGRAIGQSAITTDADAGCSAEVTGTVGQGATVRSTDAGAGVVKRRAVGQGGAAKGDNPGITIMRLTSLDPPAAACPETKGGATGHSKPDERSAGRQAVAMNPIGETGDGTILNRATVARGVDRDPVAAGPGGAVDLKAIEIDRHARGGDVNAIGSADVQVTAEIIAARGADNVSVIAVAWRIRGVDRDAGGGDLIERLHRWRGRAGRSETALGKGGRQKEEGGK